MCAPRVRGSGTTKARPGGRASSNAARCAGSDRPDVRRLEALRALLHLELDPLPFLQAAEALRLDGGVMDEDVVPAAVLSDEAEALRVVEPLHGTTGHLTLLSMFEAGPSRPVPVQ